MHAGPTAAHASGPTAGFEELYGSRYHVDILDIWTHHTPYPFNQAGRGSGCQRAGCCPGPQLQLRSLPRSPAMHDWLGGQRAAVTLPCLAVSPPRLTSARLTSLPSWRPACAVPAAAQDLLLHGPLLLPVAPCLHHLPAPTHARAHRHRIRRLRGPAHQRGVRPLPARPRGVGAPPDAGGGGGGGGVLGSWGRGRGRGRQTVLGGCSRGAHSPCALRNLLKCSVRF